MIKTLAEYDIPQDLLKTLEKTYYTADEVLQVPVAELAKRTRQSLSQAQDIVQIVSKVVLPKATSAQQLIEGPQFFTTGDSVIDDILGGGIRLGIVTEISGESATGKTQLTSQLCLSVQLSPEAGGLGKGAAIISTETRFNIRRINDLIQRMPALIEHDLNPDILKANINVINAFYLEELDHVVSYQLPTLLSKGKIALIIIDSITANFRGEDYGAAGGFYQRGFEIASMGHKLQRIAMQYNVAVICINQVSDSFRDEALPATQSSPPSTAMSAHSPFTQSGSVMEHDYQAHFFACIRHCMSTTSRMAPSYEGNTKNTALGLVWSNVVKTRLMLSRTPRWKESDKYLHGRNLTCVFAANVPRRTCRYVIEESGVRGDSIEDAPESGTSPES